MGEQKLILIDKVRHCQRADSYERYIKGVVVVVVVWRVKK